MRPAVALLAFVVTVSCAATKAVEEPAMKTLAQGSYAADDSGRKAVLAATEAEYEQLWKTLVADGTRPRADFEEGVVVILLAGQRSTGGHSVEPSRMTIEDRTVVVEAAVKSPPAGSVATQVITSPWAVVFVSSREAGEVRWTP